jgi:hypothetical protein
MYFSSVGGLLLEAHRHRIAIPVRPAGVRVGAFVELDAALAVDEQRPISP